MGSFHRPSRVAECIVAEGSVRMAKRHLLCATLIYCVILGAIAFDKPLLSARAVSLLEEDLSGLSGLPSCPGDTRSPGTCDQDTTHRVCAKIVGTNFWGDTNQPSWTNDIGSDGTWCICMWATAEFIEAEGCDNVTINCAATDVQYVLGKYTDAGTNLTVAHTCLTSKCGSV